MHPEAEGRPPNRASLLLAHEMKEGGAESICDEQQVIQARRRHRGLDTNHRRPVQICALGELLLGPPAVETRLPDLVSDLPAAREHPLGDRI